MKHSIQLKLENLCERYDEIAALLSEPEVQGNQNKFRTLSQEYAQIGPLVDCYKRYEQGLKMLASAKKCPMIRPRTKGIGQRRDQ